MDFLNILKQIEKVDEDVYDRLNPRRAAMKDFFNVGKKVAIASVPFAIGSMFQKAYGQGTASAAIISVFNYSLAIEHFAAAFYSRGVTNADFSEAGANAAADKIAITIIRDHELGHVKFLQDTIKAAGGTPVAATAYDFGGDGEFATPFGNYKNFLQIAQGLEDTTLRATKGVVGELVGQSLYLTEALKMHSVEARHSAKIRLMRIAAGFSKTLQPWISLNDETDARLGAAYYAGEENVTQNGVTVTGISNNGPLDAPRASEAFDEPLLKEQARALLAKYDVIV